MASAMTTTADHSGASTPTPMAPSSTNATVVAPSTSYTAVATASSSPAPQSYASATNAQHSYSASHSSQSNSNQSPTTTINGEDMLSLFVSDLVMNTTIDDVTDVFSSPMDHLPVDAVGTIWIAPFIVRDVKVMVGHRGNTKYAFVRFEDASERARAMCMMQGMLCLGRPIRLSRAHAKQNRSVPVSLTLFSHYRSKEERDRDNVMLDSMNIPWAGLDPKNTKVFVGGLSPHVHMPDLVAQFASVGTITNVNTATGCAFISYLRKADAGRAIEVFNGSPFAGKPLRVAWSRSSVQPIIQQHRTFVTIAGESNDQAAPTHKVEQAIHAPVYTAPPAQPMYPTQPTYQPVYHQPQVYQPPVSAYGASHLQYGYPAQQAYIPQQGQVIYQHHRNLSTSTTSTNSNFTVSGLSGASTSPPDTPVTSATSHTLPRSASNKGSIPNLYTLKEEADDMADVAEMFDGISLERSRSNCGPSSMMAPNMGRRRTIAGGLMRSIEPAGPASVFGRKGVASHSNNWRRASVDVGSGGDPRRRMSSSGLYAHDDGAADPRMGRRASLPGGAL